MKGGKGVGHPVELRLVHAASSSAGSELAMERKSSAKPSL
jgi:hypothetical protein